MHAGNVFAYLCAWLVAKVQGGRVVLRVEDLDRDRSKTSYIDQLMFDLEALGLFWDEGPYYQSTRDEAYEDAFELLRAQGLLYPCFCTRADLHAASAPHAGEVFVYPGTCRELSDDERAARSEQRPPAVRIKAQDSKVGFPDLLQGPCRYDLAAECGDFVVKRFDGTFAYQLAVVVDDAAQGVNSVVRGVDLLSSTPQQIYLQSLLGFETPEYAHVPLVVDETGRRLAKRNKDAALDAMLLEMGSPERIIGRIAYKAGLAEEDGVATPEQLLDVLTLEAIQSALAGKKTIEWYSATA